MKNKFKIIAAFFGIYVIWGSTYLAIRFTLETLPPLLTAGLRFFIAGLILYVFARFRMNEPKPNGSHWRSAAIIGGFLILGGNGNVVLAERSVPSGVAALIVATIPIWMVLLEWLWLRKRRPAPATWVGLVLGFGGVALLIVPDLLSKAAQMRPAGFIGLLAAALLWAVGSLQARRLDLPSSGVLATGMQMTAGGAMLFAAGMMRGELSMFHPAGFSERSVAAFIYLVLFGSLWGFTAYIWLLKNVGAVKVSTYAFVNPVVAILLGCFFAAEKISGHMICAAIMVVAAVGIITFYKDRAAKQEAL